MENKQNLPQSTAISQASVQKSASISYAPQQSGTVIVPTTVRPDLVSDQRELPVDEMLESEYVALQEKQSVIQSQEISRKAQWTTLLSSVAVLSVLVLFMGGGFIANRVRQNVQQAQHIDIPEQSIALDGLAGMQSGDLTDLGLKDGEKQLVVNGNIIAKGSVSLVSNNYLGQMSLATLTEGRIYTFPDASGTVCLNTNNCNYVSGTVVNSIGGRGGLIELGSGLELQGSTLVATNTAVTTSLDGATGTLTLSGGLSISGSALSSLISSVNGVSGTIVIQGSANQTNVITSGNVVTITTSQDIATSSSPEFQSIALASIGTQNGSDICDASNNCGFSTVTGAFVQGGNSFGTNAIIGTNDSFDFSLETNGLERLTVTSAGNVGINNTTASNRLSVNTLTTADPLATIAVATGINTDKGLVIQGVASQSANLQEWQTSTGTVVASLASTGYFSSSITTAGSSVGLFRQNTASVDAYLDIYGGHNGDAGIRMYNPAVAGRYWVIRGRGSASDNFRIGTETSANIITANRSTTGVGIGIDGGSIGAQLHVNSSAAATKGVIVRGTALRWR